MRVAITTLTIVALTVHGGAFAADLSVWAFQQDMRVVAGNPDASTLPLSLAYNPTSGKLLIAGGGNPGSTTPAILEWDKGAAAGTRLVAAADWGSLPYGAVYVPSRGSYLVLDSSSSGILEVMPGQSDQAPAVFADMNLPTFPAGGMVQDGAFAYYKNQWTGLQQTINRVTLVGTNGVESEFVPFSAVLAVGGNAISQQIAIDSAGRVYVSVRASDNALRGVFRWNATDGVLDPVILQPQIIAHTGEMRFQLVGLTIDPADTLFFGDFYSGDVLRLDRWGNLSTFLRTEEVRAFMGDPSMQFHPSYMAVIDSELVFVTGNVSGHVLAASIPLAVELVTIPGTDYEVNGPAYTYKIGRYEITNAQYCVFLNDAEKAQLADPEDPRCTHMWFDPLNGDVYMTDVTVYPPGSQWYDRTLYKTSDLPDSKIKYDPQNAGGSRFYVLPDFDHHPVGTVSWFGAAKFCNWLTLNAGLPARDICYREGTSKYDWYAVTASDWSTNGLLESERRALVHDYRGYRLPMDGVNFDNGGPGNATSWNMDANPFNEWYKAAAFDPDAPDISRVGPGDGELVPPDHWTFGFGDDVVTPAEANLSGSVTPFLETTPVGWYDGVNTLLDGTPTLDSRNQYGLYDMCGNVAEWMNDTALEYPWGATYRVTRGGHFTNSDPKWATNSVRQITTARYYAENSVGFRVVRSAGYGDFDGNDRIDAADYAFFADAMTGPAGTVNPGNGHEACDHDGDDHVDLRDFAEFQRTYGRQNGV